VVQHTVRPAVAVFLVIVSFGLLSAGLIWFERHAPHIVLDCKLLSLQGSLELGSLYRVYFCRDGISVLVPAGRFPRVPGPGEDLPI
jgi:hypothetical protein